MKKLISLFLCLTLTASLTALAESASPTAWQTYDYPEWGLSVSMPETWLYQAVSLPPEADCPFHPATDTLSSRDTFYIGVWAADISLTAPNIRMSAFYTSAGTAANIASKQDQMMQMFVERFSNEDTTFTAGEFELLTCGENELACFSMLADYQGSTYVLWNFLLPYPMTLIHLEGLALAEDEIDIKQILISMASSIVAR
jgi:hypothetical protein